MWFQLLLIALGFLTARNARLCFHFGGYKTIFKQVQFGDSAMETFEQRPGSFYVGNMCAMEHEVVHRSDSRDLYKGPDGRSYEIALMLRSDVFAASRARKMKRRSVQVPDQGIDSLVSSLVWIGHVFS